MGNFGGSRRVSSDTTTVKQTVQPITFKGLANTTVLTSTWSNGINSSGKGISTLSITSTLYQEKINPTFFSSTTNIALVAGGAFGIIVVLILCLLITRKYCKRTKPTNSNESARQIVSSGAYDEGVAPGAVQIQIDVTNVGDADDMYDFDGTDQNQVPDVCASDDDTVRHQTIPGDQSDQTGSEIVYAIPKVIDRMPTSSSETIGRVVYANTPRVQGI